MDVKTMHMVKPRFHPVRTWTSYKNRLKIWTNIRIFPTVFHIRQITSIILWFLFFYYKEIYKCKLINSSQVDPSMFLFLQPKFSSPLRVYLVARSLRCFGSYGGALSTGCGCMLHSSFGGVLPLDTSPLASGGRPPRL